MRQCSYRSRGNEDSRCCLAGLAFSFHLSFKDMGKVNARLRSHKHLLARVVVVPILYLNYIKSPPN